MKAGVRKFRERFKARIEIEYEQGYADGAESADAGYDGDAPFDAVGGGDGDFGGEF